MHIIPASDQSALRASTSTFRIGRVDVAGELVYAPSRLREAVDGYQLSPYTERIGVLYGYGYYLEAGVWLMGSRDIIGFPSTGKPHHADLKAPEKPAQQGIELWGKIEQLALTYHGAARGGVRDSQTPDGNIDVVSASLGLNYWATRHLRVARELRVLLLSE